MGTKAAARAHKDAWNRAISEGRVVNFGDRVKSYLASDLANMAVHEARAQGLPAEVVDPSLAYKVFDQRTGQYVSLPPGTRKG